MRPEFLKPRDAYGVSRPGPVRTTTTIVACSGKVTITDAVVDSRDPLSASDFRASNQRALGRHRFPRPARFPSDGCHQGPQLGPNEPSLLKPTRSTRPTALSSGVCRHNYLSEP